MSVYGAPASSRSRCSGLILAGPAPDTGFAAFEMLLIPSPAYTLVQGHELASIELYNNQV